MPDSLFPSDNIDYKGQRMERCLYCGHPFLQTRTAGKPFRYCPEHRASKFRGKVVRGTAPGMPGKQLRLPGMD